MYNNYECTGFNKKLTKKATLSGRCIWVDTNEVVLILRFN